LRPFVVLLYWVVVGRVPLDARRRSSDGDVALGQAEVSGHAGVDLFEHFVARVGRRVFRKNGQ
jgi:hypothetical protein